MHTVLEKAFQTSYILMLLTDFSLASQAGEAAAATTTPTHQDQEPQTCQDDERLCYDPNTIALFYSDPVRMKDRMEYLTVGQNINFAPGKYPSVWNLDKYKLRCTNKDGSGTYEFQHQDSFSLNTKWVKKPGTRPGSSVSHPIEILATSYTSNSNLTDDHITSGFHNCSYVTNTPTQSAEQ